jgi:hypothetical protein
VLGVGGHREQRLGGRAGGAVRCPPIPIFGAS